MSLTFENHKWLSQAFAFQRNNEILKLYIYRVQAISLLLYEKKRH